MKKQIVIEIICFLFILLFMYAALSKLADYNTFVAQLGKSPLLTDYAESIAWIIPSIELIIAVMLIIPKIRFVGLFAAFGLMVMFTFYIIAILTSSKDLPCSCGGVLSMLGWKQHLVFNFGFVLLGLTGIILMNKKAEPKKILSV